MDTSPAASRTLDVLELLAASPEPVAAGHLARQLQIPKASLYRILATMAEHGFVIHLTETNRWALGVGAYELASAYRRQDPLQRMAKPLLSRLVDAVGHNGHLTVLRGSDVVYVIEERAPHQPSLVTDVGVRLPAHLTASGLAMLSAMTAPQVRSLYPTASELVQRDGYGVSTLRELREVLAATRSRGYALEEHSVTAGLASVALPVRDRSGYPLAAIALTFEAEAVDPAQREALVLRVRRVAHTLEGRLGAAG